MNSMTIRQYILTMADDAKLNFWICEEQYGSEGNHYADIEVFEFGDEKMWNAVVIIKIMFRAGVLWVESISALPDFAGVGIEIAIMEQLAVRYGQPCHAPGVTTDDEDEIWSLYRGRGPDDPRLGYLTLLPPVPMH